MKRITIFKNILFMGALPGFMLYACGGSMAENDCNQICNKTMDTSQPLTCKLTSAELQKRKATTIGQVKKLVREKQELPGGYAFRFEGTDHMIDLLADFIKSERQCCDFFDFAVRVQNNGVVWLDIIGPKGAKAFIQSELEL